MGIHQDDRYEEPASLSVTCQIATATRFLTRGSQAPERSLQPQRLSLLTGRVFANAHRVASAPKRTGERSKQMSHLLFTVSESRTETTARPHASETQEQERAAESIVT